MILARIDGTVLRIDQPAVIGIRTKFSVLLGARLLDAFADPLIGRWADALFARSARAAWRVAALAAVVLALIKGLAVTFTPHAPPPRTTGILVPLPAPPAPPPPRWRPS